MVKHSARHYASIFHARPLRTATVSRWTACCSAFWRRPCGWFTPNWAPRRSRTDEKRSESGKAGSSGMDVAWLQSPFSEPAAIRDPFSGDESGFDSEHSPLLYLVSAAPLLVWPHDLGADTSAYWRWLPRLPFLACGLFLGASLWYVARRLCGNTGGFVALTLYCFSPSLIQASAVWHSEPEIVSAWGAFGTIFTAIAVAHTLYAPGKSFSGIGAALCCWACPWQSPSGSQFSLIVLVPMALVFLLYVAPVRQRAGLVIWMAACLVGLSPAVRVLLFPSARIRRKHATRSFLGSDLEGVRGGRRLSRGCPADRTRLSCLRVYVSRRDRDVRCRGRVLDTSATPRPCWLGILFLALGMAHPHVAGAGFLLAAVPFFFIFVSGVLADLLETSYRPLIMACILTLLVIDIGATLLALARVPVG